MVDLLRNLTKSTEEKRREALNAYVDGRLSPQQQAQFEQKLGQDERLQAELRQLQTVKQNLRQLPHRRVPHNFTLDPALYGRPQREPLVQAYPALRLATALTAFFFILAIALQMYTTGAMVPTSFPASVAEQAVTAPVAEMTIESMVEAETEIPAAEMPAEEIALEEATKTTAADSAVEEEAMSEEPVNDAVTAGEASDETAIAATAEMPEVGAAAVPATLPTPTLIPSGEGEIAATKVMPTVTETPFPSVTPLPTATVSALPRQETDNDEIANRASSDAAVTYAPTIQVDDLSGPATEPLSALVTIPWLLLGLGMLLLVLVTLTLLARRRL